MKKILRIFLNSVFLILVGYEFLTLLIFSEFFLAFWWGLCLILIIGGLFGKNVNLIAIFSGGKYSVILLLVISNATKIFYNLSHAFLNNIDFIFHLFKHFYYDRIEEGDWEMWTIWPSIFLIGGFIGLLISVIKNKNT